MCKSTGQLTLTVFVYPQAESHEGTVATNIGAADRNFSLSLEENGRLVPQTQSGIMARSGSETIWLGTDADGMGAMEWPNR